MGNRDKTTTISQTYDAFASMIKHNSLRMRGRWKAEINEKYLMISSGKYVLKHTRPLIQTDGESLNGKLSADSTEHQK